MYDLHSLGWNSFQQLCLTILRAVLGQTVASFLDSNDGGRDGAFAGQWNATGHEELSGQFVVQCKFTSRVNHTLRPSDLSDEMSKLKKLVKRGLCDCYVLMTNAGLSGNQASEIESLVRDAGAKHVLLLGSTWIAQQIRESKRLRMLVPRVYGLGDLSQIIDARAYAQARSILESLREDLAKVVVTDSYRKAAAALDKHGFVLLIGEPAAGKTTIASLLAMAAVDQWGASILKLEHPDKAAEHWNPEEPSQFFWLDDAFGVTQYEQSLVHGWNHLLPHIMAMLRKGAKIVMTSRDYIYNRARNDLKEGAFPLLTESQVVIDVHHLSVDEKRQILYNHIKLGRQPLSFRSAVEPHLEAIAAHPRFIPETARRLAEPLFTEGLSVDANHLAEFVEKRERFLHEVLQNLDAHSKAAIALIFMRKNQLESPISLREFEGQAIERLGSNLGGCAAALESLNGSLVTHSHASGDSVWRFKHPTIGDAYAAILVRSPELLGILVHGSATDKLIEQVTCGDVGIEKAVIVPKLLFPMLIERLGELSSKNKSESLSTWKAKSALYRFLAHRCSKEFLALFLEKNPGLLDKVSRPGLYLSAVSEVDLAVRLHEFGLLPADKRKTFVATVSEYAVQGEDLYALEDIGIQSLFDPDEIEQLLHEVRTQLVPRLDEVRLDVQHNQDSGLPADAHMQPLLESFKTLKKCFGNEAWVATIIEREIQRAHEWIADNLDDEQERLPWTLGEFEKPGKLHHTRSIFDDIDA